MFPYSNQMNCGPFHFLGAISPWDIEAACRSCIPGTLPVTMKVVLVDLQIRRKMGIATFWSLTTRKNGDNVGIIGIVGIRNQQLSGDLTNKHV
jgi:hypothetical protein